MFEGIGMGPFVNDDAEDHLADAALVLAAGDPAVGFICLELVDGEPHIWQLSVRPEHSRRGIGRALVEAACRWSSEQGYRVMTLTTFRDVPWNAPFYASLGFREMDDLSPGLAAMRQHERDIGDDDLGARVAMLRELS